MKTTQMALVWSRLVSSRLVTFGSLVYWSLVSGHWSLVDWVDLCGR